MFLRAKELGILGPAVGIIKKHIFVFFLERQRSKTRKCLPQFIIHNSELIIRNFEACGWLLIERQRSQDATRLPKLFIIHYSSFIIHYCYPPNPFALRNIVVLLPLERSQYSLFLHLIRVPSSATGSGTLIRPNPFFLSENGVFVQYAQAGASKKFYFWA